ncbi:MAG TPA: hypothetical protein VF120_03855 [Ktedonobacterales bacterium]
MMTLQRFRTGQDTSYNVRLRRAARRLTTPRRTTAATAPIKNAWRRQTRRVRAATGKTRRIRLFMGIGIGLITLNAAITALVIVLRRFGKWETQVANDEKTATETPAEDVDVALLVEERETVLA